MKEEIIRGFLNNSGLSAKEISERIFLGPATIQTYTRGKKIPQSVCRLIELEFSEYDIETGEKVLKEPGAAYAKDVIDEKEREISALKERINELKSDKAIMLKQIQFYEAALNKENDGQANAG